MHQTSLRILCISNAENDGISFISLYSFKVLDKERFFSIGTEEGFLGGILLSAFGQKLIDQVLLRYTESHNTKATLGVFLKVFVYQIDNIFCLFHIAL